jgi:hypothetical protein
MPELHIEHLSAIDLSTQELQPLSHAPQALWFKVVVVVLKKAAAQRHQLNELYIANTLADSSETPQHHSHPLLAGLAAKLPGNETICIPLESDFPQSCSTTAGDQQYRQHCLMQGMWLDLGAMQTRASPAT